MKRLLTETELIAYLQSDAVGLDYTVHWLRRKRIEGGGIPFIKIEGKVRYSRQTVDKWLNGLPEFNSTSEVSARAA